MMRFAVVLSCFLLVLPACIQRSKVAHVPCNDKVEEVPCRLGLPQIDCPSNQACDTCEIQVKVAQVEAKFNDIPIPLDAVPIAEYFMVEQPSCKGAMLGYISSTNSQKLSEFFKAEFSRLGWHCYAELHHAETLLCFKKPDTLCFVSIRTLDESENVITISVIINLMKG